MITSWVASDKGLSRSTAPAGTLDRAAVWIDAVELTADEERLLESTLGLEMPTKAEMQEIETSSRLYRDGAVAYMTATMLTRTETPTPSTTAVTFILTRERLVTLRYDEPWTFRIFPQRAPKSGSNNAELAFVSILETTVERLADLLEIVSLELENLSQKVFRQHGPREDVEPDLQRVLTNMGRAGNILSKVRESLVDKGRVLGFARQVSEEWMCPEAKTRLAGIQRDIQQLTDHATFTSGKMQFLLDATLGFINFEQNRIFKFFSLVTVAFAPLNILAGIGGMSEFSAYVVGKSDLPWWVAYGLFAVLMVPIGWFTWWLLARFGPGGPGLRRRRGG
jgi:magnesium transporter